MSSRVYRDADALVVVNPTGLNFQSDGTDPDTQALMLLNDLQNTLPVDFTVAADETWIVLGAASGSFNWNVPYTLDVDIDVTGLADGTHTGIITLTTDFGDTEIPVVLVVAS